MCFSIVQSANGILKEVYERLSLKEMIYNLIARQHLTVKNIKLLRA